jgi:diguanylate cyclase (GGDEF)-like protein
VILKLQDEHNINESKNFNIAIIDIDHFKKFNDLYWHPVWDIALKYFVNTFRSYLEEWDNINNSMDWFFRIGWEEFVLLTRRSIENATNLVTFILQEFLQIKLSDIHGLSHVTEFQYMSFSTWIWGTYLLNKSNNISCVISQVDKALYESKDNWRSRISICSEDGSINKNEIISITNKENLKVSNS